MAIQTKGWIVTGYKPDGKKPIKLSQVFVVRESATRFAMLEHQQWPELRIEVETKMCWDESGARL